METSVISLPADMETPLSPSPEECEYTETPLRSTSLPEETGSTFSSLPDDITMDERFLSFATRVAMHENMQSSASPLPMVSDTIANILSDIRKVHRILNSYEDTIRLMRMQAVYESNQGKLLASRGENNQFFLVDPYNNGFVPQQALFPAPYSSHLNRITFKPLEGEYAKGELSAKLSKYIWQDRDNIYVQIRSRVSCYHRFCQNMKVVFGKNGGGGNGEYCLAACNCCGGITWLPKSKCKNENHVWTLHLFDPPSEGEEVHLSQSLRRKGSVANTAVNVTNNFGGNINQSSGRQGVGPINSRTEINLRRE